MVAGIQSRTDPGGAVSTTTADREAMLDARYGRGGGTWGRRFVIAAVLLLVLAAAVFSAVGLTRSAGIEGRTLTWRAAERSVSVDVELRGSESGPVTVWCVRRTPVPRISVTAVSRSGRARPPRRWNFRRCSGRRRSRCWGVRRG